MNKIFFINKQDIQQNRYKDVTYGFIKCKYCKGKVEPNRTRLTVGGDRINYSKHCGMSTADLLTIKLLLKSVIFTHKAKFMTMDINNF